MSRPPPLIADMIHEVDREIRQRVRVYARWVEGGKMTQHAADRQIGRMRDVLDLLKAVQAGAPPPPDPQPTPPQGDFLNG